MPVTPDERPLPVGPGNEVSLTVERFDDRGWPDEQLDPLFDGAFPAFITADPVSAAYIGRVRECFATFNIVLLDRGQRPAAVGWGVPIHWSGELHDLPIGYTAPPGAPSSTSRRVAPATPS